MLTFIGILLVVATPTLQDQWQINPREIQSFFDEPTQTVNDFIQQQTKKVEELLTTSYNEVNNFVKQSGRKMADTVSFVPEYTETEDEERLENPDLVLTVPGIIQRHGYSCETHTVNSKGYILNIHRIPRSKHASTTPTKTVILQHGLFGSSADWILNGPGKSLAFVLAEAGYDVWLPNIRGNKYSREHISLKTDSKSYWNFCWHDVALHDVPAIIDYIKKVKGTESEIAYVGHSMGTTILFAMLSLRPEYNAKLVAGFALAPEVFLSDVKSSIKDLIPTASNVAQLEMLYGSHEFVPKNSALGQLTRSCTADKIDGQMCKSVIFSICGYDEAQFNKTLLPVFMAHLGTGTSWKTAVHFAQEIVAGGKFQKFDYGSFYNNKLYGSETPPEYDLSKITLPIKMFWSKNDLLSSEKDVQTLYDRLPSGTEKFLIPDPNFNHMDYLWAIDAPRLLNDKVLETLDKEFRKAVPSGFI